MAECNDISLDADLILVGGGLANGLIAWHLAACRPEWRVLLLERAETLGGNHTWSFHDGDLTAEQHVWVGPLVEHRWKTHQVRFPARIRALSSDYLSIGSQRFAKQLGDRLGTWVRTGIDVRDVTPDAVVLADGTRLVARAVIDGRGQRPSPHLRLGFQKFLGQEVRTKVPHGIHAPILMDATVEQREGYRFVYVLPLATDRLLIEDTYYTDGGALDADALRAQIADYASAQGWAIESVTREEHGVLPIVLAGDCEAFWDDADGVPQSGLSAGLFHPTTGYSLPSAVALAEHIAAAFPELSALNAPALFASVRAHALERWRAQGFYRLLNRMLFQAAEPTERWRVMQRFYGLREPLIGRFYAGRSTRLDRLRILTGRPPVPLGAALRAALDLRMLNR